VGDTVWERSVRIKDPKLRPTFSNPNRCRSALPHLTVTPVALGVLALPGVATTSLGVVVAVTLVDTTGLLAGGGETTGLAVL
jgi:hypothetical protein